MTGIVINGLASAQQSHLLDGMANDDDARTDAYINPNPDAIAEIHVSTSRFSGRVREKRRRGNQFHNQERHSRLPWHRPLGSSQ